MAKLSKVEFLQTSAGSYGIAHAGDKLILNASVATELEKKGVLKVSGDAPDSATESVPSKGSVRFTDETNQAKGIKITEEKEDKYDPTNEKKNKVTATAKVSKAGPNAPKKKGK